MARKKQKLGCAIITKSKIELIDPPEELIHLQKYGIEKMSEKLAMGISQKLRKTYAKYLIVRNFGEMENAVLDYEAARTLAIVNKRIIGVIAYRYNEVFEVVEIDHIGTLLSPKGTGAELVRTAVNAAYGAGVGMRLESTPSAEKFWVRLGFERNEEVPYVFKVDFKRVRQIREALGSTGRVKDEKLE